MKHSNSSAAFSHSPFQALTLSSEGAIALNLPENPAKEEAKATTPAAPALKVRTVRRPQALIKKQPVRVGSTVKITIAPETTGTESIAKASSTAPDTATKVTTTTAPSTPAKVTAVPVKAAPALPAIFGQMKTAQQSRTSVSGVVTQVVDDGKGRIFGVRVKLENSEVLAFAPFSRLGLAITEVHGLLNTTQAFKVIEVDESKGAIVFNRQAACSEQRLDRLIELVKVGQVLKGKVRNIAECGAFVEITGTGASGLIHISKLPGESLESVKKGEEVKVIVVKVNKAKHQLGLALALPEVE
jgi:translation initiation factor 2 alpha subunit (eIF-2alpha)